MMNKTIGDIVKEKIQVLPKSDSHLQEMSHIISDLIDEIIGQITQVGYDTFLEGLADGIFNPQNNPNILDARSLINIIPSKGAGSQVCCPVLFAFSKGNDGKLGFNGIQNKIRAHLTRCRSFTKLVVCFGDVWDSQKFEDDHYEGLLALKKGDSVAFVFILVGTPNNVVGLAPVKI
jgi:hypothetical protein